MARGRASAPTGKSLFMEIIKFGSLRNFKNLYSLINLAVAGLFFPVT